MSIREIIFAARPKGLPTAENFQMREGKLAALADGQLHLKGLYYSVDPYMRGRMNEGRSYVPPFEVGQPLAGGVVARVEASKHAEFKTGDLVVGMMPWATEAVVPAQGFMKITSHQDHASLYLGLFGLTGLTAYFGLLDLGEPKAGETVVVSGAAGAVGSVVGQIARIKECRAVGIAGSDEKVKLLREKFGFDGVVNYKTENVAEALKKACPRGIDVYFDNVGGEITDAVMQDMNDFGRVSVCGQIAHYNAKEVPVGPRPFALILTRRLRVQGFIYSDFQKRWPEGLTALKKWYDQGLLKAEETVTEGFDQMPKALLGLFSGENKGKMIVKA